MAQVQKHCSYEVRYRIGEETALRLRDFVQCYMDFDEYSVGRPNFSYSVHRLYLDSDNLGLYWDAIKDPEHRRHLRIRFHSVAPDALVYVEHKRWNGDTAITEMFGMHRYGLERLLSGQFLTDEDLVGREKRRPEAVPFPFNRRSVDDDRFQTELQEKND